MEKNHRYSIDNWNEAHIGVSCWSEDGPNPVNPREKQNPRATRGTLACVSLSVSRRPRGRAPLASPSTIRPPAARSEIQLHSKRLLISEKSFGRRPRGPLTSQRGDFSEKSLGFVLHNAEGDWVDGVGQPNTGVGEISRL